MKFVAPHVALVWIYEGGRPKERLEQITGMDYPDFEVFSVGNEAARKAAELFAMEPRRVQIQTSPSLSIKSLQDRVSADTEGFIFWVDDDKPVVSDFLFQMIRPVFSNRWSSEEDAVAAGRPVMHLWWGNALCVPRSLMNRFSMEDVDFCKTALLEVLNSMLDAAGTRVKNRIQVALSSSERLAPLGMEAVGSPS